MKEEVNFDFIYHWELVKDFVVYKLVNTERNQTLLENIPHEDFLDMSKVFYVSLFDGNGSLLINKAHCAMWGITEEELMCVAEQNTTKLFPKCFRTMNDVIVELLENNMGEGMEKFTEYDFQMYILSNTSKYMGAAVLCYPNCLKMIGERLQNDFYIIPSSIHEVLILSLTEEYDVENLKKMVADVNEMVVNAEEILSYHVYLYKREQNELCIAEQ